MAYFSYHPKKTATTLIGTDVDQIIDTLAHYNLPIPNNGIRRLTSVNVICSLGIPITKHFFNAEVREGVSFQVHENALNYIKKIGESFEELKRGGLYKFDTGRRDYGLLFLPQYIMGGLKEYDWDQHLKQIQKWKEKKPEEMASTGALDTGKFLVKPA